MFDEEEYLKVFVVDGSNQTVIYRLRDGQITMLLRTLNKTLFLRIFLQDERVYF